MGTFSFTYSDRATHQRPGARAQIEENRKRFQCNLFEFWRQCGNRCWKQRSCAGDPHDCFARHHATMPRDHAARLHAAILSGTTGTATAEKALGAVGLSLPARVRPADAGRSPPPQTDDAAPAVDPARDDDASRRARIKAEIAAKSPDEIIADLEKLLGMSLRSKPLTSKPLTTSLQPGQPAPPSSCQSETDAPVICPESEIRASVEAFNERARKGMDYNDLMARLRALGRPV